MVCVQPSFARELGRAASFEIDPHSIFKLEIPEWPPSNPPELVNGTHSAAPT
jgi:hypothetical protein